MKIYQKSRTRFISVGIVTLFFSFMNVETMKAAGYPEEMEEYLRQIGQIPKAPLPPSIIAGIINPRASLYVILGAEVFVVGGEVYLIYSNRDRQAELENNGLIYPPENTKGFTEVASQIKQNQINALRAGDTWAIYRNSNYWYYMNPRRWW